MLPLKVYYAAIILLLYTVKKRVFQSLLKYRKLFFYNVENSLFKNSFLSTNTAKYSTKEYSIS